MGGFSSEAEVRGENINITLLERRRGEKNDGGELLSAEDNFSARIKNKALKTVKDAFHCILKENNNFNCEDKIVSKLPQEDLFSGSL